MMTVAVLSESMSFLIFYILKFIVMAVVIVLAVFIGVKLRKLTDAKKARKLENMVTEAVTADGTVADTSADEDK